jgi:hypothetical protein
LGPARIGPGHQLERNTNRMYVCHTPKYYTAASGGSRCRDLTQSQLSWM